MLQRQGNIFEKLLEEVILEISQNSQKSTCAKVSFLINFIKKEALAQMFSCELCEISKNTFFYRTPAVAASYFEIVIIRNFHTFHNSRWVLKENVLGSIREIQGKIISHVFYQNKPCRNIRLQRPRNLDHLRTLKASESQFLQKFAVYAEW